MNQYTKTNADFLIVGVKGYVKIIHYFHNVYKGPKQEKICSYFSCFNRVDQSIPLNLGCLQALKMRLDTVLVCFQIDQSIPLNLGCLQVLKMRLDTVLVCFQILLPL